MNSINLHALLGSYYYHPHLSDDEIKAQKDQDITQKHRP